MMDAAVPMTVAREGGLAVVTVESPPLNLFDMVMRDALVTTVGELEQTSPRAVLFRFEGKVVTAGVDVHLFDALSDADEASALFAGLVSVAQRLAALPCPTVFAAHGLCLTWGFELALACDLILASERASFGLIEATVGLTPAMGGTQRLAERAGSGRARELVMSAERYDAATLHQWGVVNRVLAMEGFDAAARQVARRPRRRPDPCPCGNKGHHQRLPQRWCPAGRCPDTLDRRRVVRHPGSAIRHAHLPDRGPWPRGLPRTVTGPGPAACPGRRAPVARRAKK